MHVSRGTEPKISLAIVATSADKLEGTGVDTPFTFTITRTGDVSGVTTVDYAVAGLGPAAADAADAAAGFPLRGRITFAAGERTKVATGRVKGDAIPEPNEIFTVTLSNASAGAVITTATAAGRIRNDDMQPAVAAAFYTYGIGVRELDPRLSGAEISSSGSREAAPARSALSVQTRVAAPGFSLAGATPSAWSLRRTDDSLGASALDALCDPGPGVAARAVTGNSKIVALHGDLAKGSLRSWHDRLESFKTGG
jgi:hypothetical protein